MKKKMRRKYRLQRKKEKNLSSMMVRYTSLDPEVNQVQIGRKDYNEDCKSCGLLLMADYEYYR